MGLKTSAIRLTAAFGIALALGACDDNSGMTEAQKQTLVAQRQSDIDALLHRFRWKVNSDDCHLKELVNGTSYEIFRGKIEARNNAPNGLSDAVGMRWDNHCAVLLNGVYCESNKTDDKPVCIPEQLMSGQQKRTMAYAEPS